MNSKDNLFVRKERKVAEHIERRSVPDVGVIVLVDKCIS